MFRCFLWVKNTGKPRLSCFSLIIKARSLPTRLGRADEKSSRISTGQARFRTRRVPETFEKSKLNWQQRYEGQGQKIAAYYQGAAFFEENTSQCSSSKADRQIKQVLIETAKFY